MLEIKNVYARHAESGKEILQGVDLVVPTGELHAIMGVNGSGKSTLANVLAGNSDFEVTGGEITLDGQDLLELEPDERSHLGLFLAFQYPVEIPGLTTSTFIRAMLDNKAKAQGEKPMAPGKMLQIIRNVAQELNVPMDMLRRAINQGFSGGEKKRLEILQMLLMEPKLAVLDETDSGLDIDALKIVAQGINKNHERGASTLIITHYQRLLNYVPLDKVHVFKDGRIVRSGDRSLVEDLEKHGYADISKS